jgi:hypothetical protein
MKLKPNEAEYSRDGEGSVLLTSTDVDLFGPLMGGSMPVTLAREIVEERRRQEEETERRELVHEKHRRDCQEALDDEFGE